MVDITEEKARHLAEELRKLCDKQGKEKPDLIEETSQILCEIGLLYKERKNLDKVALIQSASLLNAAIVRQKHNPSYKQHLQEFCNNLLLQADAVNTRFDLLEFSAEVKRQVDILRENTLVYLSDINMVPDGSENRLEMEKNFIRDIQDMCSNVANMYRDIMKRISIKCVEILGKPPCRYALVGMGSLARREITPYSDFEHILLMEDAVKESDYYHRALEYFRWYSVIFQVILVNLRETLLRFMAIPYLNDGSEKQRDWFFDSITPCGICPDGFQPKACKSPLGRTHPTPSKDWTTEFIKPVHDMAMFLNSDVSLKEGYHISNMLRETCFVEGDEGLHQEFTELVQIRVKENIDFYSGQVQESIKEDLENLSAHVFIAKTAGVPYNQGKLDVKRALYRTSTLFVSQLGKLHNVKDSPCFDIIQALKQQGIITEETAHLLSYAVALSCYSRLYFYMNSHGQDDMVEGAKPFVVNDHLNDITKDLIATLGEKNLFDYFLTVCNLEMMLKYSSELSDLKAYISSHPTIKFQMLGCFRFHKQVLNEWEFMKSNDIQAESQDNEILIKSTVIQAYLREGQYDKCKSLLEEVLLSKIHPGSFRSIVSVACSVFLEMGDIASVVRLIAQTKDTITRAESTSSVSSNSMAKSLFAIAEPTSIERCFDLVDGLNKFKQGLYDEAVNTLKKGLDLDCAAATSAGSDAALRCELIAGCLSQQRKFSEAIAWLKQTLPIIRKALPTSDFCNNLTLLGKCCIKESKYDEALEAFQEELSLRLDHASAVANEVDAEIDRVLQDIENTETMIKENEATRAS